jgi:hypothetical protein
MMAGRAAKRQKVRNLHSDESGSDDDDEPTPLLLDGKKATNMLDAEPYPEISFCGDWECINGPPGITNEVAMAADPSIKPHRFETYALCDACTKMAPDTFLHGIHPLPAAWVPRMGAHGKTKKLPADMMSKRRTIAATYLSTTQDVKVRKMDADAWALKEEKRLRGVKSPSPEPLYPRPPGVRLTPIPRDEMTPEP